MAKTRSGSCSIQTNARNCSVKHSLTSRRRHHNEENNCNSRLRADCAAGINGPGHIVNKKGEVVRTAIKAGARVRVYYVNTGGSRVVDHVVVEECVFTHGISRKVAS